MTPARFLLAAITAVACSISCASSPRGASSGSGESSGGGEWTSLQSLSAWRGYKSQEIPKGWSEVDGMISKTGDGQDLVSRKPYRNFEFTLDWKLGQGGNSGIFYHATEEYEHIYWSAPEYQLLDNARHPDGKNILTQAASAYGLYAPPPNAAHEAGEWNSTTIIIRGAHVEHWLNGVKVVEYELGSSDWTAKVKASKFGAWPNYGKAASGYIGIQGDHNGQLMLRNIKIRELP